MQINRKRQLKKRLIETVSVLTLLAFAPHSVAQTPSQAIALPAQPLQASLEAIGKQYGVTVIAPAELVAGKAAAPVNGTLSAQDALFSVLAGTDLVLDRAPSGDFMLKPAPTLQQATQSSALEVEDVIIVKGTKLEGTLQDIETSIEIFDQSRIDREEIVDLLDVLLRIPNVTTGSGFGNDFSIRGIGRRGATGAGAGIASNVYVDGSPISPLALNRGPLSLWDVGQIEVLRGPQSSVQGRNALAGAIVISTNDPTYEFAGQVRATYGRYNDVQLAGAIGGPIVQDQIAARIAVDYQNFDGFITQRFNENFENAPDDVQANARESILVRGKLLVEPNGLPSFATKFTVDYIDSTSGDPSPRIRSEIDVDNPAFEDFDFFDFVTAGPYIENNPETLRIVNETTYTLTDNWLLRGILTYENTEVVRSFDIFEGEPVDEGFTRNVFENEIFSAEARAEFTYQTLRGFIGGYYYDEQGSNANEAQDLVVNLPGAAGVNPADSVAISNSTGANGIENFAAFGQLEWDIDEHWRLNLGFRYDNERITAVNGNSIFTVVPDTCTLFVPGALVGQPLLPFTQAPCQFAIDAFLGAQFANIPGINTEFSDRFEAFLPRAAITYNFNDNNSVFISYQRGYRAGGANFVLDTTEIPGINVEILNTYDPEFLNTFEIGTRNVFFDGALVANANVFYSKYTDQQTLINGPLPDTTADERFANVGESSIYGAEFSLDYTLNDNWNFLASVGLLKTEFDDFEFAVDPNGDPINEADPRFANLAGNEFPFAPNITFTLSANYQHDSGVYASGTFTFTGRQFTGSANLTGEDFERRFTELAAENPNFMGDPEFAATLTNQVESRSDITLRVGYRNDRFNVFAAVANLLDAEQLRSRSFGSVGTTTGVIGLRNEVQGLVIQPRSFRVGVDVFF